MRALSNGNKIKVRHCPLPSPLLDPLKSAPQHFFASWLCGSQWQPARSCKPVHSPAARRTDKHLLVQVRAGALRPNMLYSRSAIGAPGRLCLFRRCIRVSGGSSRRAGARRPAATVARATVRVTPAADSINSCCFTHISASCWSIFSLATRGHYQLTRACAQPRMRDMAEQVKDVRRQMEARPWLVSGAVQTYNMVVHSCRVHATHPCRAMRS